ncbi:SPX and EXS domain-containing protein 1-like [Trifolium pratense]|uniref:SPX and EXS domain-containing protein 1-like n=1 Tax=Trifolium pratense TaxID=57577 RepID=A0A2K3MPA2_TRIPR|nr:SPX and EXS domain-containing protein 1-like [Trifolium pratense]
MFGGLAVPANSPHLRKSGSRTYVYDLDDFEGENGADESLLNSVEVNDMRGGNTPMNAAAMMPSPILLWRFKVGWDSVMRMSADKRDLFLYEAFLYFNPLLLAALMVWLWGINLWVFAQGGANYAKIFDLDQNHLTHREIWKCAMWMTIIVPTSMTAYIYLYSHGEVAYAASQPV